MELLKKKTKRKKDNDININKINEMIIIYKIKGKDKIKLFGEEFIKNNYIIIIENKELNMVEYLNVNSNDKILKIKLKEIKIITNMSYMFYYCNSLTSLPDISNWNTNNVTNMMCMFYNCNSLTSLPDISNWNTNNVIMCMFYNCNSLPLQFKL